jgi:acetylornithine/N-succinyldiaminopimelate aminotransferase
MGRTGKLFAHEWSGVTPDVMSVAKAIGGGFPLGACLATENAASGMVAGTHGSTYGGNPLAMAVGIEALDLIAEPDFLETVRRVGARLHSRLETVIASHPKVFTELRGVGMMLGLRCAENISNLDMVRACQRQGLLVVGAADNVIRLLPPLIIGDEEIKLAGELLDEVASKTSVAAPAGA